ncbi:MAG TPA: hypothetical protein DEF51_22065 [Myxococcales bacterium]|nr:hypothetical protein [Myxococcales bacterium]
MARNSRQRFASALSRSSAATEVCMPEITRSSWLSSSTALPRGASCWRFAIFHSRSSRACRDRARAPRRRAA